MSFKEIDLCAQNLLTILDLVVNKFRGPTWLLKVHLWTLKWLLTPIVFGIDPNLFRHICGRIDISTK